MSTDDISSSTNNNDPWIPQNLGENRTYFSSRRQEKCGQPDFESEKYLSRLEAKLDRLKGKGTRGRPSKEIIDGLQSVKSAHMTNLFDSSNQDPFLYEYSDEKESSTLTELQRRLNPEQAVNEEELKKLIDHDDLEKQTEESMNGQVDRGISPTNVKEDLHPIPRETGGGEEKEDHVT